MGFNVFYSAEKIDAYAHAIGDAVEIKDSAERLLAYKALAEKDDTDFYTSLGHFIKNCGRAAEFFTTGSVYGMIPAAIAIYFAPVVGLLSVIALSGVACVGAAVWQGSEALLKLSRGEWKKLDAQRAQWQDEMVVVANYDEMRNSPKLDAVMAAFPDINARFKHAAQREHAIDAGMPTAVTLNSAVKPAQPTK